MKIGPAFSDNIHTTKRYFTKKSRFGYDKPLSFRMVILPVILGTFAFALLGRLFFLQILRGQYFHSLSDTNRLRAFLIYAPRGIVFDRNGKPLVLNVPGFREVINGKTVVLNEKTALEKIAQGDKHLEVDSLRYYP